MWLRNLILVFTRLIIHTTLNKARNGFYQLKSIIA